MQMIIYWIQLRGEPKPEESKITLCWQMVCFQEQELFVKNTETSYNLFQLRRLAVDLTGTAPYVFMENSDSATSPCGSQCQFSSPSSPGRISLSFTSFFPYPPIPCLSPYSKCDLGQGLWLVIHVPIPTALTQNPKAMAVRKIQQ